MATLLHFANNKLHLNYAVVYTNVFCQVRQLCERGKNQYCQLVLGSYKLKGVESYCASLYHLL